MLSFALGREIHVADSPAIDRITQATIDDGYRMQTLIKEIIFSEPFRQESAKPAPLVARATD